jgi:mannose-1-phosphate guanylyltransferase
MAGGVGSRFWPVSRTDYPKQFLDILGTGQSLIQQTFRRFQKMVPEQNIYVVTSDDYMDIVHEQLPALPLENIVGEPERKNTAPCIAYISFKLLKKDKDACIIVTPSDHLIINEEVFTATCRKGLEYVLSENVLITLGITPKSPNTGYGYIQFEKSAGQVCKIKSFKEKPGPLLAAEYFNSGDYLWNSGIFIWKVSDILESLKKFLPDIYELFNSKYEDLNTVEEEAAIRFVYEFCPSISIDYGILEKAKNVCVVPASFEWSDLGTWNSAWQIMIKDNYRNAKSGNNVMTIDTANCMIHSSKSRLVVLEGLDDYIIADTDDVLLICRKEKEQYIKDYVQQIKEDKGDQYLFSAIYSQTTSFIY